MILLIDNYDSFTYNLVDYFGQLGVQTSVFRNDDSLELILGKDYQGVVLSPGPEKPEVAGNLLKLVETYIGNIPMLGICLGHQAIAQYFGAKLVKASYPMHGKISKIRTSGGIMFQGLPESFDVVRYHSLIVENLPKALKATAFTMNKELMAFEANEELMASGVQFHPEAVLTQYGLDMIRNWVTFYNIA